MNWRTTGSDCAMGMSAFGGAATGICSATDITIHLLKSRRGPQSMTITISQVVGWLTQAVSIALIVIFAVTIAQHFGFRIPVVPTMEPLHLLYFAAAWAFIQGRIKLG